MKRHGFTLLELLVVLAILGLLAAVLFPVFAHVRENGRRTACLSNERQVGMAMLQYVADNGETFPSGLGRCNGDDWVTVTYPYANRRAVFQCPDEATDGGHDDYGDSDTLFRDGYGLNMDLGQLYAATNPAGKVAPHSFGYGLSALTAPAQTALFFEVDNGVVVFSTGGDAIDGSTSGSGGLDGTFPPGGGSTAPREASYPTGTFFGYARYATGNIGGRQLNGSVGSTPRHAGGSNYVACDGHAVWLRPEQVSGGKNQPPGRSGCAQDDAAAGCGGADTAAGTGNGKYALTFSIH